MSYNFIECNRNQIYLMPPSLKEWLPEGHLAWFVLDAIEQMDLKGFYERYRADGWGGVAYEPSMMVALLLVLFQPKWDKMGSLKGCDFIPLRHSLMITPFA